METLKFNDDEFPIASTGEVILIAMDELHSDFLRLCTTFQERVISAQIPQLDLTAKLMYCMLKAANPESFKSYKEFMHQNKNLAPFINADNLNAMMKEINSAFGAGETDEQKEEKEAEPKSKKKQNH